MTHTRQGTRMSINAGQQKHQPRIQGFTLLEMMLVVAIIGLLAVIALPTFARPRTLALGLRTANDMRVFADAFLQYAIINGSYPADNHEELPPGMEDYIDPADFDAPTGIGGRYNWEGPDSYPYAGLAVSGSNWSAERLLQIDMLVDDGNLSSGSFRVPANGRFTYVIEE